MAALEIVTGFATAPGAVATAVGFSGGTTGTIRNFSQGNAWLLTAWQTQNTTAGYFRVRSPRLHDFVQGIRMQGNAGAGANQPSIPLGFPQRLVAQDTLTVELSGSAVAGDIINVALLIYYDLLDSANGRFIDLTELENRMVNLWPVTFALVGAVTGAYGAQQALTAGTADTSRANTDYALLGMTCSESAANNGAVVRMLGVDTGNLGVGIPICSNDPQVSAGWFIDLCKRFARPLIPVVNSANKGATMFDVLNNENANTVTVSLLFAELR